MTVDFNDYFWGEKNNGFDVLYHNMKYGLVASKDLAELLRERSNIEENNSKLLAKFAKQAGSCCNQGTFAPLWQVLKTSAERLSALHMQMVQKVSDLVKEVNKYAEELHKKHKTVKEDESGTLESVQAMQNVTLMVQKCKDTYTQRGQELDKLRKDNASPKEIEKAELKMKKAQEEYKSYVEKYTVIKDEFEKKMSVTCKNFQELEVAHLGHMKEFLNSYAEVVEWTHEQMGKVHKEFRQQCLELTVDQLLEQFVRNKSTGLERPGIVDIEEALMSPTQDSESSKPSKREGFLRSRREKAKQKKSKKKVKDNVDTQSNKEEKSDMEEKDESQRTQPPPEPSAPELDEDGYVIRPNVPHSWNNEKGSFYSSSDSDTDDERERKIHVEIKPLNNGSAPMSASVDELRATVENLYLSPTGGAYGRRGSNLDNQDLAMKRSQSVSQQLGKPSSDLLGLNFVQSPNASNSSTPTSSHPYAPLQSPSQLALNSPTLSASSRYADLGDLLSEDGEAAPGGATKQPLRQTPTPTSGYMSIPRPPSRRSDPSRHINQSNISRADSISSLEFRTACVPVGVSRGPSPLTIGMADTIPLAVAFHEIVHSYFRGADETRCQVKMSGEMMLSFPAGIVTILANNPNPAKLVFRVKNTQRLVNILPNKQLVAIDNGQSSTDNLVLEFNMSALSALLKKQSEQNPSASYFNVDILKYQIKAKPGANSCPFQLVAYWKCTSSHTDLKVDYKYNSHSMSSPTPLLNVTVAVPVDGGVKNHQLKPAAQWLADSNRVIWKFTELSQHSENHGVGSMLARFELENGPTNPATISAAFNCEGTTLSGIEFQLVGTGYRLSLVKRRFISGKYICDGDLKYSSGTGTPSTGSAAASTVSSTGDPNC
ncbi:F-BAR domain only protein 2 isoform X3 [Tribolium castaneum]|uniref:FCH domain only protein 2-like Protein n=1 Tax=Tribolium castaneum TaxID=7070 RepID=D6W7F0_TRICA|nr:PREDICTED: F-BAR domain only protein 2 isoform X3 [Tribolium castaneum]EFA11218.2 FCH domain only protein 2-like Protein [Tribolium castaneum]|eukprot:XP_008199631.1 PREDICTED: F-BAR domain only protein 2 isoform X3 [Tribolium castaneum]